MGERILIVIFVLVAFIIGFVTNEKRISVYKEKVKVLQQQTDELQKKVENLAKFPITKGNAKATSEEVLCATCEKMLSECRLSLKDKEKKLSEIYEKIQLFKKGVVTLSDLESAFIGLNRQFRSRYSLENVYSYFFSNVQLSKRLDRVLKMPNLVEIFGNIKWHLLSDNLKSKIAPYLLYRLIRGIAEKDIVVDDLNFMNFMSQGVLADYLSSKSWNEMDPGVLRIIFELLWVQVFEYVSPKVLTAVKDDVIGAFCAEVERRINYLENGMEVSRPADVFVLPPLLKRSMLVTDLNYKMAVVDRGYWIKVALVDLNALPFVAYMLKENNVVLNVGEIKGLAMKEPVPYQVEGTIEVVLRFWELLTTENLSYLTTSDKETIEKLASVPYSLGDLIRNLAIIYDVDLEKVFETRKSDVLADFVKETNIERDLYYGRKNPKELEKIASTIKGPRKYRAMLFLGKVTDKLVRLTDWDVMLLKKIYGSKDFTKLTLNALQSGLIATPFLREVILATDFTAFEQVEPVWYNSYPVLMREKGYKWQNLIKGYQLDYTVISELGNVDDLAKFVKIAAKNSKSKNDQNVLPQEEGLKALKELIDIYKNGGFKAFMVRGFYTKYTNVLPLFMRVVAHSKLFRVEAEEVLNFADELIKSGDGGILMVMFSLLNYSEL